MTHYVVVRKEAKTRGEILKDAGLKIFFPTQICELKNQKTFPRCVVTRKGREEFVSTPVPLGMKAMMIKINHLAGDGLD